MATSGGSNLNKYWGSVVKSVGLKATTAELWGALKDAASANPGDLAGVTIFDVNAFRSAAAGMRRAGEVFASAASDAAITSEMVAQTPFSAPLDQQNLAPVFNVTFERTFLDEDGIENVEMRTDQFTGGLPGTVQDLIDTMSTDMDNQYGGTTTGIGSVTISMGR